jgi:siroheme synthase (precorrin-2 oxidase/ferrochelatase)
MAENFPEIQGGGSLILAWQVRNKKVLVIGGGEVRETIYILTSNKFVDIENARRSRLAES